MARVPVPTQVLPLIVKELLIVTLLIFNAALPVLMRRNWWVELNPRNGEEKKPEEGSTIAIAPGVGDEVGVGFAVGFGLLVGVGLAVRVGLVVDVGLVVGVDVGALVGIDDGD